VGPDVAHFLLGLLPVSKQVTLFVLAALLYLRFDGYARRLNLDKVLGLFYHGFVKLSYFLSENLVLLVLNCF
jgi:hypothetical protein